MFNIRVPIMLLLVMGLLLFPSLSPAAAFSAVVTVNPTGLAFSTWELDFQFNNGNATAGDNDVQLTNFTSTGLTLGSLVLATNATGTLNGGLQFTDANLANPDTMQTITPTLSNPTISFLLTYSSIFGNPPDEFVFTITDMLGNSVACGGGCPLLTLDFGPTAITPSTNAADAGYSATFTPVSSIPEPGTAMLLAAGCGLVLVARRKTS